MSELKTYALSDLDNWTFEGTALAVLGHPIKHSVSPQMHNAALAEMAKRDPRFATWKYFRFDIAPEDLPVALEKLHARNFHGINLTVPHKVLACGLIKDITIQARQVGAVNTLLRKGTEWVGFNTDGYGLANGLREDLKRELGGSDMVLLGAGGAARGAAVECARLHSSSLWIINRTAKTAHDLAALANNIDPNMRVTVCAIQDVEKLPHGALVINATSAGLKHDDPLPIDLAALARPAGVYDMIYNPPETRLLAQARALGLPAANGLSMLVHQGARALEIWSETAPPVDVMRTAVHSAMKAPA